jgi:hypothetical protein
VCGLCATGLRISRGETTADGIVLLHKRLDRRLVGLRHTSDVCARSHAPPFPTT